jgi:hypothetical protein
LNIIFTYLIFHYQQTVFLQEFGELQWVHESSMNGVTAIRSSKPAKIIIIYDAENKLLVAFFDSLQVSLTHSMLEKYFFKYI